MPKLMLMHTFVYRVSSSFDAVPADADALEVLVTVYTISEGVGPIMYVETISLILTETFYSHIHSC